MVINQWMEWDTLFSDKHTAGVGHLWSFFFRFGCMSLSSHEPTIFMRQQNFLWFNLQGLLVETPQFFNTIQFNLPAFSTLETESTRSNFSLSSQDGGHLHQFSVIFPSSFEIPINSHDFPQYSHIFPWEIMGNHGKS